MRTAHVVLLTLTLAGTCEAASRRASSSPDGDSDVTLRTRAAILRAEDERNAADPLLRAALSHPDASMRARAVRALGRIGDASAVAIVSAAAADRSLDVQRAAVFALGEIESPRAFDSLARTLVNKDAETRALVVEALAKIAWSDAEKARVGRLVVERVLVEGAEKEADVIARALTSSWRFGGDVPGLASVIAWRFLGSDPAISEAAAYAASRLGDERLDAVLEFAARDPRATVRANGVRGMGRRARSAKSGTAYRTTERRAILLRRAIDLDPAVRVAAFSALEVFEPSDLASSDDIVDLALRSDNPGLERAALTLVKAWKIDSEAGTAVRLLASDRIDLIPEAAQALVAVRGEKALGDLELLAKSPDWRRRAAAAGALGVEPMGASEAGRALQDRFLLDSDPRVVAAALDAAVTSKRPDATVIAAAHLAAEDEVVRAVAASSIPGLVGTSLSKQEASRWLRRTYNESRGDDVPDARLASLEALAELDPAAAAPDLARAAGDPAHVVRMQASALLRKAGADKLPLSGPVGTNRPLAHYVEAARDEASGGTRVLRLSTTRGDVDIELLPAEAVMTVRHMEELAERGYFDGIAFHRIVPDFVVQGGDPRGDGWGGPGYAIRCEINDVPYDRGAVGMALSGKDTGGSQFFVTLSSQPHLDGGYTVFGHVTPRSMSVVDALRRQDTIVSARLVGGPRRGTDVAAITPR